MLSFPVDTYTAVHHMSSMLGIDFCFPKHGSRQKRSNLPEIRLVALLVVAVKMYYSFDSQDRHPRSQLDVAVLHVDWDKWGELQEQHDRRLTLNGEIGRGNEMLVTEQDVMKMSGGQLDEYLDWYEKTWINEEDDHHNKKGLPKQLLDMFPTSRINSSLVAAVGFDAEKKAEGDSLDEKLRMIQSKLKLRPVVSAESEGKSREPLRRLGSLYKRYRKIEDLPPQAKRFHEAAASLIGVSMTTLLMAVRQMEVKLRVWRAKHLKDGSGESDDDQSVTEREPVNTSDTPFTSSEVIEVEKKRDI